MRGNVPKPPIPRWCRASQWDSWETSVNLCMTHREIEAAKWELKRSQTKSGNGIRGVRFPLARSLGRICPVYSRSLKVLFSVHDKELREAFTQRYVLCEGRQREEANAPGNAEDRVNHLTRKGAD